MPDTLPKLQRLKGLALIAVAVCGYGFMQYWDSTKSTDMAERVHKGDPLMAEAISRARQGYEAFFAAALKPAHHDERFRVFIAHVIDGTTYTVGVGGLHRTVRKAAFVLPVGESYKATIETIPDVLKSRVQVGTKVSFDPSQIVDWMHRTADGKVNGAFTQCVDLMNKVGRMELNGVAQKLQIDCNWLPQVKLSSK